VLSGGSATFTTINRHGLLTVSAGGFATSTTINSGGSATVLGNVFATTIDDGGSQTVSSGGVANQDVINSGGLLILSSGGLAVFDTINSGGSETVLAGGITRFATISGGGLLIIEGTEGTASGSTIVSSGTEIVRGGEASFDTISSGGQVIVSSGGRTNYETISAGGSITVLSGGYAYNGTIGGGGSLLTVSAGGTALNTTVNAGGLLVVSNGGTTGSTLPIANFEGVAISSGGSGTVLSGGIAYHDVVFRGGSLRVGGTVIVADISGGSLTVSSGGTVYNASIRSGGNETVLPGGSTSLTMIFSGGSLAVSSGGTASSDWIYRGGSETVSSGGTTIHPTISGSGAVLDLLSGAVVGGGIRFLGSGGHLEIEGTPPTSAISGFTVPGDVIDLTTLVFSGNTSVGFSSATDTLTVIEGGGSATIQLDIENYSSVSWVANNDGNGGTEITVACYCRGTLIRTEAGEVAIEDLAIGDRVVTLSGAAKPVKWIGYRAYDGHFAAGNRDVLPVRITADAFADGVPARDLLVSPEHSLYFDGALVAARQLVNGATIVQETAADRVEYFHIELDAHDVIFAEDAAAESYVDCANRGMFHNAAEFALLYPADDRVRWQFCAPRLE
jgi:autotransporter passenger strand-loop-strand repeat protein